MDNTPQLITPQVINEVEFRQKVRGYDPDEVDDFLERMAIAVADLQDRLREATERAAPLEARPAGAAARPAAVVAPQPAAPDEIETIRRTLVLAQRTADAAVHEAEQAAAQTVSAARQEADRVLDDARSRAATVVSDAEAAVERETEAARGRLVTEVERLERTLEDLHGDVALMERHVEDQRVQLRGSIEALQRLLDDPSKLKGPDRADPLPGARPPAGEAAHLPEPELTQDATSPFAPFPSSSRPSGAEPTEPVGYSTSESARLARGDDSSPGPFDDFAPQSGQDADDDVPAFVATLRNEGRLEERLEERIEDRIEGSRRLDSERERDARSASPWSHVAASDDELGLPTGSFRIDDPNATDDAYLDELRKAMIDPDTPDRPVGAARDRPHDDRYARPHDGPLDAVAERDGGDSGLFDQDDFDDVTRARNRFGRRR